MIATYRGIEISLDESNCFIFSLDGKVFRFPSYQEVREQIDERIKQREKEEVAKLSIPAITGDLRETTVTGVHAGNGDLLMRPTLKADRYDSSAEVFYRCKESIDLVQRMVELHESLDSMHKKLNAYRLTWRIGKGWQTFDRSMHAEYVHRLKDLADRLEKEYGDKDARG
jgi:hypothetical protein